MNICKYQKNKPNLDSGFKWIKKKLNELNLMKGWFSTINDKTIPQFETSDSSY